MGKRIGFLLVLILGFWIWYWGTHPPQIMMPDLYMVPANSYEQALVQYHYVEKQETTGLNPLCHSILLTHGQRVAKTIAFIHGYTNCPAQFTALSQQFYDRGYNVLILRLPHHGLADRMTHDLTNFTAEEMIHYAEQVSSIAHGLGEHISVVGLSGGGVIAAYAAQVRPEVDQAILIAPGFGLRVFPDVTTTFMTNFILWAPERFQWWDIVTKDTQGIPNAYPQYSWHGLAQQLRLSLAVQQMAKNTKPAAKNMVVITNANDEAVDNAVTARVVNNWRNLGTKIITYEFPKSLGYRHDLIDPHQATQHTNVIYPVLLGLIDH